MDFSSWLGIAGQLLLAAVLGGLVGLEREVTHHAAGFRTHILVCIGSALVMQTGIYMLGSFEGQANVDPSRLAAQVISGIGFLGAGAILRDGLTVRGLTTAASLWVVACIGLAVGSGFYIAAILATCATFLALTLLRMFSGRFERKYGRILLLRMRLNDDPASLGELTRLLSQHSVSIHQILFEEGDGARLNIQLRLPNTLMGDALVALLGGAPFVKSLEVDDGRA